MEILILIKQKARKLFLDFLTLLGLNKENSMYYIGGAERPTVTVSEGADYVITYESESGYNSTEFPTEPGTYSLVVTVNENDLFKADKIE